MSEGEKILKVQKTYMHDIWRSKGMVPRNFEILF